jgi:hypothetical protein
VLQTHQSSLTFAASYLHCRSFTKLDSAESTLPGTTSAPLDRRNPYFLPTPTDHDSSPPEVHLFGFAARLLTIGLWSQHTAASSKSLRLAHFLMLLSRLQTQALLSPSSWFLDSYAPDLPPIGASRATTPFAGKSWKINNQGSLATVFSSLSSTIHHIYRRTLHWFFPGKV